jgi:CheY-like chemotaxis protein
LPARRAKMKDQIPDLAEMPELPALREAQQALERCQGELRRALADEESDEREAIEAGFDVHMTKPVNLRKLTAVVEELLARKRS